MALLRAGRLLAMGDAHALATEAALEALYGVPMRVMQVPLTHAGSTCWRPSALPRLTRQHPEGHAPVA